MIYKRLIVVSLWLVLLCGQGVMLAEEPRVLRVTTLSSKPWGFHGPDGSAQGIIPDWISAIMSRLQVPYTLELANVARIRSNLKRGSTDVTILLPSPSLFDVADCLEHTTLLRSVVVGRRDVEIASIADLYDLPRGVGQVRGTQYGRAYDEDAHIKKYQAESYEQIVRMLFKNRIDAVVGTDDALLRAARSLGFSKEAFGAPFLISQKEACLFYSKTSTEVAPGLKQALIQVTRELRMQGVFREVEERWTGH